MRACFNPRARDGRDLLRECYRNQPHSFNPRARDGRDNGVTTHLTDDGVSIHAPVMDAMYS